MNMPKSKDFKSKYYYYTKEDEDENRKEADAILQKYGIEPIRGTGVRNPSPEQQARNAIIDYGIKIDEMNRYISQNQYSPDDNIMRYYRNQAKRVPSDIEKYKQALSAAGIGSDSPYFQSFDAIGQNYANVGEYLENQYRQTDEYKMLNYDLEAGQKEIDRLKQKEAERNKLRSQLNFLQSGGGAAGSYAAASGMYSDSGREEEIKRLQAELAPYANVDTDLEQAQSMKYYSENFRKYNEVQNRDDFSENSQYKPTGENGWWNQAFNFSDYATKTYELINNMDDANSSLGNGFYSLDQVSGYHYDLMEPEERKMFNYLYNTQGMDAASEYLDYIQPELNRRNMQNIADQEKAYAQQNFGTGLLASIGSVPNSLFGGLGALDVTLQKIQRDITGEYKPIDYNTNAMIPSIKAASARQAVGESITNATGVIQISEEEHPILAKVLNGKSLADVYNLGMSIVDSAAAALLTKGLGAIGVPQKLASGLGSSLLGGNAASQGMIEAVANGATDEQALQLGLMNGLYESLFEAVSIDNLTKDTATGFFKTMLKQGGIEASEEAMTTIANTFADIAIMAENSGYEKNVAAYMEQGMSREEAEKKAFLDSVVQVGWDAFGGFLSGGVSAGGKYAIGSAVQNITTNKQNAEIYGESVDALVAEAMELTPDNDFVKSIQEKLGSNKKVSGREITKLIRQNEAAIAALWESEAEPAFDESDVLPEAGEVTPTEEIKAEIPNIEKFSDDRTIQEFSEEYGKQADAFVSVYRSGNEDVSPAKFNDAFQKVYYFGKYNTMKLDRVLQMESIRDTLSESQIRSAYQIGIDSAAEVASSTRLAQPKREQGIVSAENVSLKQMRKRFNDTQNKAYKMLSFIASVTKKNIVLFDSSKSGYTTEQGSFDWDSDTIRIDISAGIFDKSDVGKLEKYTMLRTFTHEFTHFTEKYAPEEWNNLRGLVFEELQAKGVNTEDLIAELRASDYNDVYEKYIAQGLSEAEAGQRASEESIGYDAASREAVAEAMVDVLQQSSFVEKIAAKDQNLSRRILTKLKEFLKDITDYFNSIKSNPSYEANLIKSEVEGIMQYTQSIVDAWDKAAVAAVENRQKAIESQASEFKEAMGDEYGSAEFTKSGDLAIVKSKDESKIAYNTRTYKDGGRALMKKALRENGFSEQEVQSALQFMDNTAAFVEDLAKSNTALQRSLDTRITVDMRRGKAVLHTLTTNGDYPVNFDLTTICKKRVPYQRVLNHLLKNGYFSSVVFDSSAIEAINQIMIKYGFETACPACFVESRRMRIQKWAETFVEKWNYAVDQVDKNAGYFNFASGKVDFGPDALAQIDQEMAAQKTNKKGNVILGTGSVQDKMVRLVKAVPSLAKKVTVEDILLPEGIKAIRMLDSNMVSLLKQLYGAASPKITQEFEPYNSDAAMLRFQYIRDVNGDAVKGAVAYVRKASESLGIKDKNDARVQDFAVRMYLYDIGGARSQSFSDFIIENVFDKMQLYADLAAKRFPLHEYTKEISSARIYGLTGGKENLSIIHHIEPKLGPEYAGLSRLEDGSIGLRVDDYENFKKNGGRVQSIGYKDSVATMLDPRYSPDVGTVAIGFSDRHIRFMLDDPYIRMVIPYHKSGLPPVFATLTGMDLATDYTDYQNTTIDVMFDLGGNVIDRPKGSRIDTQYLFNKTLQETGDAREAARKYVEWCRNEKNHPIRGEKGKILGYARLAPKFSTGSYDFTEHENYYKLLVDFNAYDSVTGKPAPQGEVKLRYPGMDAETTLSETQIKEYEERLRKTGIFNEEEIKKYVGIAQKSYTELISDELASRKAYNDAQDEKFGDAINEIVQELTTKHGTNQNADEYKSYSYDSGNFFESISSQKVQYSKRVKSKSQIDFLENQEHITTYKTMQLVDGKLYPPMAARVGGEYEDYSTLGEWEEAVEHPELIQQDGKFKLDKGKGQGSISAAYNPYMHSSNLVINDQFTSAYKRNNLVVVECVVPSSEETSKYKAEFAKDTTGWHSWHTGTVAGAIRREKGIERKVFLSRWIKPVRILPDSEVASMYRDLLSGTSVKIPDNVVTPNLLDELRNVGVQTVESGKVNSSKYQRRQKTFSDREILLREYENIKSSKLTDTQQKAVSSLKSKIESMNDLVSQRNDLGREYQQNQFTSGGDRNLAKNTMEKIRGIDEKISALEKDIASIEATPAIKGILKEFRGKVESEQRAIYQEKMDVYRTRTKESAEVKKYRSRIEKDVSELSKWVTSPDNKTVTKHIPEAIRGTVVSFLTGIDFSSKRLLSGGAPTKADATFAKKLAKLKSTLNDESSTVGLYSGYADLPEDFMAKLDMLSAEIAEIAGDQQYVVNSMNSEQLKNLSSIVRNLKAYIQNFNRFHNNSMFRYAYEAGESTMQHLRKFKRETKMNATKNFLDWQIIRPIVGFDRFGEGGKAVFNGFLDADEKFQKNTKGIMDFVKKSYTEKEVKEWQSDIRQITLEDGDQISLPVPFIMSFYCLYNQQDSRAHIEGEGIRVATFKKGRGTVPDDGHVLSESDIQNILGQLDERQTEVAKSLQQFMATKGSEYGNYVSVARFGEKQFGNPEYFPINSDGRNFEATAEEHPGGAALYALLNASFTKQRKEGASNRIIVYDIFDVFSNHMASMAQYNAYALPILDALKWLNYEEKKEVTTGKETRLVTTDSVRSQMAKAYGMPSEGKGKGKQGYAESFVVNLIKALNGAAPQGTQFDSFGMKSLSRYNRAMIAFNGRVVVQQPISIIRAAEEISYNSILKALKSPARVAKAKKEMMETSGVAFWKSAGFFDTNISSNLVSMMKYEQSVFDKVTEVGMIVASKADEITWSTLWLACKYEVEKSGVKPGSDDYLQKVNDLFRDTIYRTQVVDSVLTKGEFIRDKGFFAKTVGAFMSEPTTSFSLLVSAYDKYREAIKTGSSRSDAWKQSRKSIARTLGVYGISAVLLAVTTGAYDALRDDDDYQTFMEKWESAFGENVANELIPFSKIPIVADGYELFKEILSRLEILDTYGSPPNSVYMQWFDTLADSVEILHDRLTGTSTNYQWYGGIYKLLQAVSGISGLPIAAMTREAAMVWNNTVGAFNPDRKLKTYEMSKEAEIKYAYYDGYLTFQETVDELVAAGRADTQEDAYWKVKGWDASRDSPGMYYSPFDNYLNAILSGGDVQSFQKELLDNGYSEEQLQSKVKSQAKEWYENQVITKQKTIDILKKYSGMSSDDIDESVKKWSCKVVTGTDYSDIKSEYMAGNLSLLDALKMYKTYGAEGSTSSTTLVSEAFKAGEITQSNAVDLFVKYCGYDTQDATEKTTIMAFEKKYPFAEGISYSATQKYSEYCEPAGVSARDFYNVWKFNSDATSDKDEDGNTITDSQKKKVLEYIDDLSISDKQKDALYMAFGWAESKLDEAPWH